MIKHIFIMCFFLNVSIYAQEIDTLSLTYYNNSFEYNEKGNYEKALFYIDKAIALSPNDDRYIMQKAIIKASNKQYKQAIEQLDIIRKLNKESENSILLRSIFLEEIEEYEESLIVMIEYCESTSNKNVCHRLAMKLFSYDLFEESIEYYYKILEIDPRDIMVRVELARILYSVGDNNNDPKLKEKSFRVLYDGVELTGSSILKYYLSQFYTEEMQYDKALVLLNEVISEDPQQAFLECRAEIYEKSGDIKGEIKDYESLLEIDNCNNDYFEKILNLLFTQRDYEKVISLSKSAIKCDNKNTKFLIEGLFTSYFFIGDDLNGNLYLEDAINKYKISNFNTYFIQTINLIKNKSYDDSIKFIDLSIENYVTYSDLYKAKLIKAFIYLLKDDYATFYTLYSEVNDFKRQNLKVINNKINFIKKLEDKDLSTYLYFDFNRNTGTVDIEMNISNYDFLILNKEFNFEIQN